MPEILKENLDYETTCFLTNIETWRLLLKSWINYIRNDSNLTCPSLVRKTNLLSLGLVFSDDLTIKELNNRWRRKNIPTDVLSFPALDENLPLLPNQSLELGDIFLSVDTAIKQSNAHQHSLNYELKWLVSHGLLHLLGWDHPSSTSLDKMLAVQEKLIATSENVLLKKSK